MSSYAGSSGHAVALEQQLARWARSEERVYAIAMADPQHFERLVAVVGATASCLSSLSTLEDLAEARASGAQLARDAAESLGVPPAVVGDHDLIADAAFELRRRQVVGSQSRRRAVELIAAARARGEEWVVLGQTGQVEHPGLHPYARLEMRLADGHGLLATVDVDPDTYRPVYGVQEVLLEADTGLPVREPAVATTFRDRGAWEAELAARSGAAAR